MYSTASTAMKASLAQRARNLFSRIRERLTAPTVTSVPRVDMRGFARYTEYFNQRCETLARDLASGRLNVDTWRDAMRVELERLHTTARVVGRGGIDGMSAADIDAINAQVSRQAEYLNAWADGLRKETELDARAITNRARLYAGNANETLQSSTVARLGLPELPAYPGDGTTECMVNCHCRWQIRKLSDGDYDVTWVLGRAEHCPTCQARARAWSPLQVRAGVIQPFNRSGLFT